MTREEYFQFHESMTKKMNEITRQKNADYTGAAGDDPFANFNRVGSLGVCSTEQGFMVRMLDKYMRINSFVQKGFLEVKDESVEDTLLDLANYAILFAGYFKSEREDKKVLQGELEFGSDGRPTALSVKGTGNRFMTQAEFDRECHRASVGFRPRSNP